MNRDNRLRIMVLILGLLAILQFFIPHNTGRWVNRFLLDWLVILEFFALIAGIVALVRGQLISIRKTQGSARIYPGLFFVGLAIMIITGLVGPIAKGSLFDTCFRWFLQPLQSTLFSLLAFYMAYAAFRSFRLKSAPATILLLSAVIMLMGRMPLGERVIPNISLFANWIVRVPNVGSTRGLWIGIGLAGIATAMRVIIGIEGPASWRRR